jgi:aminopeptidase N
METLEAMMEGAEPSAQFIESFGAIICDLSLDKMVKAQLLELPSVGALMQRQEEIDVVKIISAIERLKQRLAVTYRDECISQLEALYDPSNCSIDAESMGKRALKNRLLALLMSLEEENIGQLCKQYYDTSLSMSDRLSALELLENYAPTLASEALQDFYTRHRDEPLLMNKYFSIRASSRRSGTLESVRLLQEDPAFDMKVPNLVRALIGSFARNPAAFYDVTGEGYRFVADKIIELDVINPQIASGLAGAFKNYGKLSLDAKRMMQTELEKIKNHPNLSNNVYEIIAKILQVNQG